VESLEFKVESLEFKEESLEFKDIQRYQHIGVI
jgi:hypothetical protein